MPLGMGSKRRENTKKKKVEAEKNTKNKSNAACCKRALGSLFSTIGLGVVLVGYLCLGAATVMKIEGDYATENRLYIKNIRKTHMVTLLNTSVTVGGKEWAHLVDETFKAFQRDIYVEVKTYHWDGQEEEEKEEKRVVKNWNFVSALIFCITVITTIGYGNITPITLNGKFFIMMYGLLGIPLALVFLANIGSILASILLAIVRQCKRKSRSSLAKQIDRDINQSSVVPATSQISVPTDSKDSSDIISPVPRRQNKNRNRNNTKDEETHVPLTMTVTIILSYLFLGAMMFSLWEKDWSFLDSFYFCFTTLTTVGFGDYVFGSGALSNEPGKLAACAIYIVLGLAIIAMSFELLQQSVKKTFRKLFRKITGYRN